MPNVTVEALANFSHREGGKDVIKAKKGQQVECTEEQAAKFVGRGLAKLVPLKEAAKDAKK